MPTFVEKLSNILNIDDSEAKSLISKASLPQLISLTSAITNNDKETAKDIYYTILGDDNFYMGQQVSYNDKKAIITKPNIGGNLVQISQNGELDIVNKRDLTKIDENVYGLNSIPGFDKMKVLAGIKPMGAVGPGSTNDPSNPKNTSNVQIASQTKKNHNQPTSNASKNAIDDNVSDKQKNVNENFNLDDVSASDICFSALDVLCDNINDVPISDLSAIRQKLNNLLLTLNEGVSYLGRSRK